MTHSRGIRTSRAARGTGALHRVVVADPHDGMRRAVMAVVAAAEGVEVIAAVGDAHTAGAAARAGRADTVVIDAELLEPGDRGLGALPTGTRIIAIGLAADGGAVTRAIRNGAHAYVVKDRAHVGLPELLGGDGGTGAAGRARRR